MRLVIIDDDTGFLDLCRTMAGMRREVKLVGTSTLGGGLAELLAKKRPEVVLLDLALPDRDGLSLIEGAKQTGAVVVIATLNDYAPLRQMALELGAHAVISKAPVETLFDRLAAALDA